MPAKSGASMRNGFALAAHARQNAGAMTHKRPARLRLVPEMDERACRCCGEMLESGDTWSLCVSCAVEHAFPAH